MLGGKKEHFCEEYIIDYNGTRAAIRAGYPEKTAAKRACLLLKEEEVRARILELQEERRQRLCVSADFVMKELLDTLQRCKAAVPVEEWSYDEHRMVETGVYGFDSKGACKCLELLGKYLGVGEDRTDGGVVYIKDDVDDGEEG